MKYGSIPGPINLTLGGGETVMRYGSSASLDEASLSTKGSWALFFHSERVYVANSGPSLAPGVPSSLVVRSVLSGVTMRTRLRGRSSSSSSVGSTAQGAAGA